MSETSAVRPHLERRFETHRVVFWHDPEGEYAADLDTLGLEGVQTVRVANDEYAIKNRLLHLEPEAKFLVYRSGAVPTGVGNWLLDLELAYGVFTADRTSLVQQELGLTANGIGEVVQAHEKFFRAIGACRASRHCSTPTTMPTSYAPRCARCWSDSESTVCWRSPAPCSSRTPTGPTRSTAPSPTMASKSSTGRALVDLWLTSPSPGIDDFVLWMFRQAIAGFKSERPGGLRNIQLDFASLRNDRHSQEALTTLAKRAAGDLDYASTIEDASFRDLLGNDLFEEVDRKIISDLARAVAERAVTAREVTEVIRSRQSSIWIDGYRKLYAAIGSASDLLTALSALNLSMQSFDEGLDRYRHDWFRIDQLYRQFIYAARTAEFTGPLEALRAQVEKFYANKFLYDLGNAWQQQVDGVDRWRSAMLPSADIVLRRPRSADHPRWSAQGGRIISDALRYEVADELGSRIRQEDRFDATLDAMLGVLPSYTQLGMAALLPHTTIGHSKDGDPVVVDGQRSDGTVNRSKILDSMEGERSRPRMCSL